MQKGSKNKGRRSSPQDSLMDIIRARAQKLIAQALKAEVPEIKEKGVGLK